MTKASDIVKGLMEEARADMERARQELEALPSNSPARFGFGRYKPKEVELVKAHTAAREGFIAYQNATMKLLEAGF